MRIKTNNLDEIRNIFEQEGIEDYGIEGFGQEVVDALTAIGAKDGDDIVIYQYWYDETGAGTINGRTFYEDMDYTELRFMQK